ncbi:hypothetical protein FJ651_12350 [Paucihalobacter ruber]|uniref:CarboxypepD_reg-like domain-containing protein n=1 Tax=Paucihalobacter ruber TaxID=2567861 RepID=A0A506PIZ1_9FLAO|nr:hypothetical protein [Paucihalobacter ruber]TPV32350.1 hypothetical protein FJ651_12350 [Paucihalobacter ruber]
MKYCISLVVVIICFHLNAQTVSGIIYDEDEALVAVKITNKSQNIMVLSNTDGTFSIPAKLKDSLQFQSSFHLLKTFVVSEKHFVEDLVIELKKSEETLGEVYLENEAKVKFFEEKYSATLSEQIANDIKNNSENYSAAASGNMDFIAIFGMVAKLFKGKKTKDKDTINYLDAKQFKVFFEEDKFFNHDFLLKDLNIGSEYHELFFDYLETKAISSQLLEENEQINLIALFLDYSKEFKTIIAESINQRD